jgi:putative holliday junction resolvase
VRILGLDIGSKRIGVAISDELGFTAQGLDTIQSKGDAKDIHLVLSIIEKYNADEIVVGMPLNMDGSHGPQANKVQDFIENLEKATSVPIKIWDERLSTVAAERILLEADTSRSKRRKVIDKVAAVLILQGYLDSRSYQGIE